MTSNASHAAGARRATTEHTVTVKLTPDDLTMIRAFEEWDKVHPTCSPKKDRIERGYGKHTFPEFLRGQHPLRPKADTTGPNVFKRLVALHVIEHSRNGHCWLTSEGKRIAEALPPMRGPRRTKPTKEPAASA